MAIKIALAGNPNCGKTTMFNQLTGSTQYVGNWPGVTVEKKEGKLKGHKDVTIVDLPGIYSLSPYTLEEVVARDFLIGEKPDAVINLVDGSNIERNLYLTTQLMEARVPVVIALNMMDLVAKSGDTIDAAKLAATLGCEVVETSALKGMGLKEVSEKAIAAANGKVAAKPVSVFSKPVETALAEIASLLPEQLAHNPRWYAVKLYERDEKVLEQTALSADVLMRIEDIIVKSETALDDDAESIVTNERYEYITEVVKTCCRKKKRALSSSDKIDRIVTNRWLALPIFATVMFVVYYVSVTSLGTLVTDWANDTLFGDIIAGNVTIWLENVGAAPWLVGLIVDGIIGGVGAVLGFVPQMFILFFFLSILEDCGYMARVAFIMDRIFRRFGLSGKSFIPMLISSGCGVPGIMATRTIENEKDRRMTIMLTTFVPCGAKLPIIALIAGAFFPSAWWVAPSAYFLGVGMIILSGIILKKSSLFGGDPAPFVMELPQYHLPSIKGVLLHVWERGKAFVVKAFTVIFVACGIIWFLSNFGWNMQMVENSADSMLATLGGIVAPLFAPLGFGTWQGAVATISALVAKENAVAAFGVLFGLAEAAEDDPTLLAGIATMFTAVSGYAFLAFNLFNPPCFAAIGAMKREIGGWKWTGIAIAYQTLLAYVVAFIINQLGSVLFLGTGFNVLTALSILFIGGIIWLVVRSYNPKANAAPVKEKIHA